MPFGNFLLHGGAAGGDTFQTLAGEAARHSTARQAAGKRRMGGASVNLNQLKYFRAAYEKRSYAAAAKSIPISHQGLKKSIASLENELGVPLFETGDSNVLTPTDYADELERFASTVDGEFDGLMRAFDRITRSRNTIRLGTSPGVLGFLGLDFLKAFRREHPGIGIAEEELSDLRCDDALRNGDFDLALVVDPCPDDFASIPLYAHERSVWVSRKDPLAGKDLLTIEDLEGYFLGVMGNMSKVHPALLRLLEERRVNAATIDCATEMIWLGRYARKMRHASFTSGHVADVFANDEGIVARPFIGLPWGFSIAWLRGRELSANEQAFVRYCQTAVEEIARTRSE